MRLHPNMARKEAANAAILRTPFGRARADAGYELDLDATGDTQIVTGDPPRTATSPTTST